MISTMATNGENKDFNFHVDRFADIEVLRYEVPEYSRLSLDQKKMLYYLSQAAQMGRDIIWDQNGRYNLQIRQLLEKIYTKYDGDRNSKDFKAFEKYLKQVWFGNGIHHHYSTDKFQPEFSQAFFEEQVGKLGNCCLPLQPGQNREQMMSVLVPVIFDPSVMAKRVNQDGTQDVIATSANNLYGDGVTQAEVEAYYNSIKKADDPTPISYGLNSRVVKENGKIKEQHYSLNGVYGPAISQIIYWLDMAKNVAENDAQKAYITKLIDYYITGDLRLFDSLGRRYKIGHRLCQRFHRELRRSSWHDGGMGVLCKLPQRQVFRPHRDNILQRAMVRRQLSCGQTL